MKLPEKLDHCPKTPECMAKRVYRDTDTGDLYKLDTRTGNFEPHKCSVRGSEKPRMVYLGEWYNSRTGRTRWLGPERMRASVEKPPAPGGAEPRRNSQDRDREWEHKGTYVACLDWRAVLDE